MSKNMTTAEFEKMMRDRAVQQRVAGGVGPINLDPPPPVPAQIRESVAAKVILPGPKLNQLEQRYLAHLQMLVKAGVLEFCCAPGPKLWLAHDCWYWSDFMAQRKGATRPILIETKGWLRDDARDKFKQAVARYGQVFEFLMIQRNKNSHKFETIMRSPGAEDL